MCALEQGGTSSYDKIRAITNFTLEVSKTDDEYCGRYRFVDFSRFIHFSWKNPILYTDCSIKGLHGVKFPAAIFRGLESTLATWNKGGI